MLVHTRTVILRVPTKCILIFVSFHRISIAKDWKLGTALSTVVEVLVTLRSAPIAFGF